MGGSLPSILLVYISFFLLLELIKMGKPAHFWDTSSDRPTHPERSRGAGPSKLCRGNGGPRVLPIGTEGSCEPLGARPVAPRGSARE